MFFCAGLSITADEGKTRAHFFSFGWKRNEQAISQILPAIRDNHRLNALAFPESRCVVAEGFGFSDDIYLSETLAFLTDGDSGDLRDRGRVPVTGVPARAVYYFGRPVSVREILVFSGNGDTRGNQDFEVRLADNSEKPGIMPDFSNAVSFSSGNTLVGVGEGGVVSMIRSERTENVADGKYDWAEFLFWPASGPVGAEGKGNGTPKDWSVISEIQIVADPETPDLFSNGEEQADWLLGDKVRFLRWRTGTPDAECAFAVSHNVSVKRAIEQMEERFGGLDSTEENLRRWKTLRTRLISADEDDELLTACAEFDAFRREVLLSNPLLDYFARILVHRTHRPFLEPNWISDTAHWKKDSPRDAIIAFDPKDRNVEPEVILEGPRDNIVGDICLHWDADRFLVTALAENDTWQIFEYDMNRKTLSRVTPDMGDDVDNANGCYVPDGSVIFVSNASMMGVPCIDGASPVGNLYRVEADRKTVRQLTFEQDQDWYPTILPNGRILYLRWEYIDTPHYFSRILSTMNPDGTNQIEHYGSGSYWPNSIFFARPLPGQSSKFVGIVSGHHGSPRQGELVLFDPALGRQEDQGVIQRIPGYGKKVEPMIADTLIDRTWPRFLYPYPLSDEYFLVSGLFEPDNWHWSIYLVDVFDNILSIYTDETGGDSLEPIPLMPQKEPELISNRTVPGAKEATVFITDVYFGQGLPDVPRDLVKKLRVYTVSYGYRGIGGHDAYGMESCWDGRRILGEVPVYEDGSASFRIPANTPIVVQPLDEAGAAVQLMRSWLVGMPGENVSCIGCHETQNSVSPVKMTVAQRTPPKPIEPFYGPARAFTFLGEIQPILDRYCVGCHDGSEENRPNFADISPGPRGFSKSYHALHPYLRRPGPESDIHVLRPMEYHVSTSELFQMLMKGHHGVKLDKESREKLETWVDLNVPFFGTWTEIAETREGRGSDPIGEVARRHVQLKKLYADNDLDYEADSYAFEKATARRPEFIPPGPVSEPDRSAPNLEDWPIDSEMVHSLQFEGGNERPTRKVRLCNDVSFEMVKIPAGTFVMGDESGFDDELPRKAVRVEKSFWMMTTEVTNAVYAFYDASHDSRFIDMWLKDHEVPGYPANLPNQPVIRVSWNDAQRFCVWLSEKTGKTFRLPTEAEWEWSARAGSASPMWYGDINDDFSACENLADRSTRLFASGGVRPQPHEGEPWEQFYLCDDRFDDGNFIECSVGSYKPNSFGLYDMLGNVSEWTASDYRPYPYVLSAEGEDNTANRKKTVRGGSWADRPKWSRAGVRRAYEPWQRVHNVGFRVVCDE
ncbi:MAG: SUMF1/EgtB/PvdO family nonheme iron enzyme [Thermoguttaceae bacterium]|nr:SUMF1/EgtB/PvdO family nonheme iron enzyme [Thermoguttaceae bacterium]